MAVATLENRIGESNEDPDSGYCCECILETNENNNARKAMNLYNLACIENFTIIFLILGSTLIMNESFIILIFSLEKQGIHPGIPFS